jgi:F0F1-type ATP synthase assembly protein I
MVPFNNPIPDSKPPRNPPSAVKSLANAENLMQIAILLPASAFVGWLAGAWLDSRFHQTWIALVGILFGGISGLVYVVRLVMRTGAGASNGPNTGQGSGDPQP